MAPPAPLSRPARRGGTASPIPAPRSRSTEGRAAGGVARYPPPTRTANRDRYREITARPAQRTPRRGTRAHAPIPPQGDARAGPARHTPAIDTLPREYPVFPPKHNAYAYNKPVKRFLLSTTAAPLPLQSLNHKRATKTFTTLQFSLLPAICHTFKFIEFLNLTT